jgi:uncharacterized protein (TIGR02996 family)
MIKKPPYRGSSTAKVWRRVFDVLVANGDPRLLEALPALDLGDVFEQGATRDITQRKLQAGLAKLVTRFPTGAPELEGRARALFDRLGGRTKAQGSSVDELFARVLESPDDDGARLVYADALQEAGDPRGELIVLQFQKLSRKLTPEEAKHEKKLLHDHFARYFGELAPVVEEERTIFEKGFPVRVCCNLKNETQRKLAVGHPLWATVKTVDVNYAESLPFDVLTHPAMKSLEAVVSFGRPGWLELGAREEPLPWTRVGYTGPSLYKEKHSHPAEAQRENREDREVLMRLYGVLPKLRRLSLSGYLAGPEEYSEWLWDAPVLQQLEQLDVSSGVRKLSAWVAEVERRGLPRLHTISSPYYWDLTGWDARVAHGDGGPWSSLRAHGYPAGRNGHAADPDHLVEALAALPEDLLTEVHIVSFVRISKATASAIESAARRQRRLATFTLS